MKKILALTLVLTLLLGTVPAQANEYTTDGTANCVVTATVASSYVVSIPATLSLSKVNSNYVGTYTVGVKGDVDSTHAVDITPNATVTLSATGANDVVGQVTQAKTRWASNEIAANAFNTTTGTVTAAINKAGSWSGNLSFAFGLVDVN